MTNTINHRLARWMVELKADEIPEEVITQTKFRVLDLVGAMLGGSQTVLAAQVSKAISGPEHGSGTPAIGRAQQTGTAAAALLQGTMGCVMEYDDTHILASIHSSTPVVAAALAKGQQSGVTGRSLLEAVLVGNELSCRIALAAPGAFHRAGFHPTAVLGVFGACYAVARMSGLNAGQVANAIGISGSLSSGIMASWEDGTDAKSLHAGWAASAGVQAVNLALCGVTGPSKVFEGRFGFFPSHLRAEPIPIAYDAIEKDLGQVWEVLNIAPREFACGHYIQPFIDATLQACAGARIDAADISEVVCSVADYMVPLICEPVEEKLHPTTSWHARYSLPFCVAECLLKGSFTKYSLAERDLVDERYLALMRKIRYEIDKSAPDRTRWSGEVRVVLRSGQTLRHRVEDMRGSPRNPMTTKELIDKFLHNTEGIMSAGAAAETLERILALESASDIREVFAPLSRGT
ncbi:MAG: MmgE/PrpD family protein [Burkholderiaceae bacterium]|nr:MmgE/PrpD family protein [Burkholderiaceae bacterium]MDO9089072.1 MmgE/PrpD family protein [Burkholderiaceae bacterium]